MHHRIGGTAHGGSTDAADEGIDIRPALARWASGASIVATRADNRVLATTVTAFTALSVEPPLILICLGRGAVVRSALSEAGTPFVVNVLHAGQRRLASIFADIGPLGRDAFPAAGPPVIADSLAVLHCTVEAVHEGGDHAIVVGRVRSFTLGAAQPPLLRFQSDWHSL